MIEHVDVRRVGSAPESLTRLHTLISELSPSRLLVSTGCYDELNDTETAFDTEKIYALLPAAEAASITHLAIDMFVNYLCGTEAALLVSASCFDDDALRPTLNSMFLFFSIFPFASFGFVSRTSITSAPPPDPVPI